MVTLHNLRPDCPHIYDRLHHNMTNDMKLTLDQRQEKALELRRKGYNCAQSVIMAFPDITGLDNATAARLTSALGAGVGSTGEICGAALGMSIAEGMRHGAEASEKVVAMRGANVLLSRFKAENGNRIVCRELKGKQGVRPCDELILQAITILHESMQ